MAVGIDTQMTEVIYNKQACDYSLNLIVRRPHTKITAVAGKLRHLTTYSNVVMVFPSEYIARHCQFMLMCTLLVCRGTSFGM